MKPMYYRIICLSTVSLLATPGCARAVSAPERNPQEVVALADIAGANGGVNVPSTTAHVQAATAAPAPPLPRMLEEVNTITILAEVTIHTEQGDKQFVRDITRARDRMHVAYRHQGQEWLFIRNPFDHRRAIGELADHRNQTIFTYYESDLADAGVGSGWRDVMTLGFPLDALAFMKKTGKKVTRAGMVFEQSVRDDTVQTPGIPNEVWWNDTNLLPLIIVRTLPEGGIWRQELTRIEPGGDPQFLMSPGQRFQTYIRMDKADWADSEPVESGTAIVSEHNGDHHH